MISIDIDLTVDEPEFQWDNDELVPQLTGSEEEGDSLL